MKKMSVAVAPRLPYIDVDFSSSSTRKASNQSAEQWDADPDEDCAGQQRPPGSVPVRKLK